MLHRIKYKLRNMKKRNILTFGLVLVIFVMSLGYAALSQYMDIEGIAMIDRSWIIKITSVTSSVTGKGVDNGNSYASTTTTMHAVLPTSSSTVTYTITLENQGNLVAKLNHIEKIEDENTGITYVISGVTEGETLLKPGETNIVTVTVKYADGVNNVSDTSKDLMLTFNYIEDAKQSIIGGSDTIIGNDEKVYTVGELVKLKNGKTGYVVEDSPSNSELVTIYVLEQITTMPYDTTGAVNYDPSSTANIGHYIENTYLPSFKDSIIAAGGNATGITARLITKDEMHSLIKKDKYTSISSWTMTSDFNGEMYVFTGNAFITANPTSTYGVAPTVTLLKSNVLGGTLASKILSSNKAYETELYDIDFSQPSSNTNGKGLYYMSDDDGISYFFRGDVDNNYVQFGEVSSCMVYEGYSWYDMAGNLDVYVATGRTKAECEANGGESCTYESEKYVNVYDINGNPLSEEQCSLMDYGTSNFCIYYDEYEEPSHIVLDDSNCIDGVYENNSSRSTEYSSTPIIWRIVRINGDGSVRLVSEFTEENADIYDYDTGQFINYAEMNGTTKVSSNTKTLVDSWYNKYLSEYSSYLEDTTYCSDREVAYYYVADDNGTGKVTEKPEDESTIIEMWLKAEERLYGSGASPKLTCRAEDRFTVSTNKGNGLLDVPIGLLSADEVVLAGAPYLGFEGDGSGSSSYLKYKVDDDALFYTPYYITMTPAGDLSGENVNFSGENVNFYGISNGGLFSDAYGVGYVMNYSARIRPVINLKSNVTVTGTGYEDDPYVVQMTE